MKIVICIKPVKAELVYTDESRVEEYVMNPYDLYAFEKILCLKNFTDCNIICLCMGPMSSTGLLQKAIAMGADEAIILNDDMFRGSDTFSTSYILSQAIKKIGDVDIVACGRQSIDGETGQVVYGISERLNYYCLSNVDEIVAIQKTELKVKQVKESEIVIGNLKAPAVVSFHDFVVTQPQISLAALKKARKREIFVWNGLDLLVDASKCGLEGSKTKVVNMQKEIMKKPKVYITGNTAEKAELVYSVLTGKVKDFAV
jgi:electron transfer flavoprotein beta subunit